MYLTQQKSISARLVQENIAMEVDVEESEEHPLCVGHELVDEYRTDSEECQQRRTCKPLTNKEINQIQECLMKIVRPSWH